MTVRLAYELAMAVVVLVKQRANHESWIDQTSSYLMSLVFAVAIVVEPCAAMPARGKAAGGLR